MIQLRLAGIKTVELIPSNFESLYHTLKIQDTVFHVVVMKKIEGHRIDEKNISEEIVQKWARVLSKLHRNSDCYSESSGRAMWNQDSIFLKAKSAINLSTTKAKNDFLQIVEQLNKHDNKNNFGLIHGDLHQGNFFIKNQEIIIFDFDDANFHWHFYDLVIPIISIYMMWEVKEEIEKKQKLIHVFIESYFSDKNKPIHLYQDLKLFMRYRFMLIHFWLIAIRNERELSEKMKISFDESINEQLYLFENMQFFDFMKCE